MKRDEKNDGKEFNQINNNSNINVVQSHGGDDVIIETPKDDAASPLTTASIRTSPFHVEIGGGTKDDAVKNKRTDLFGSRSSVITDEDKAKVNSYVKKTHINDNMMVTDEMTPLIDINNAIATSSGTITQKSKALLNGNNSNVVAVPADLMTSPKCIQRTRIQLAVFVSILSTLLWAQRWWRYGILSSNSVKPYQLVEIQEGKSFLDHYTFYEGTDFEGSNGYNTYVSKETALNASIIWFETVPIKELQQASSSSSNITRTTKNSTSSNNSNSTSSNNSSRTSSNNSNSTSSNNSNSTIVVNNSTNSTTYYGASFGTVKDLQPLTSLNVQLPPHQVSSVSTNTSNTTDAFNNNNTLSFISNNTNTNTTNTTKTNVTKAANNSTMSSPSHQGASKEKNETFVYLSSTNTTEGPRKSIRLEGKTRFDHGLFLFDLHHMPAGCGTWPAFWLTDENVWPNNGEIDIVESANYLEYAKTALHTSNKCDMSDVKEDQKMTGDWDIAVGVPDSVTGKPDMIPRKSTDCFVYDKHQWLNQGCVAVDKTKGRIGVPFNGHGGGVYALEWDPDNRHIRSWVWTPHEGVPQNVRDAIRTSSTLLHGEKKVVPNPDTWGLPFGYFSIGRGTNCKSSHFQNMRLVINLAFCGSVAGNRYPIDCPTQYTKYPTCEQYVATNPTEIEKDAYWKIKGVYVYQRAQ